MATGDAQFDRQLSAIFSAEAAEHVQRMQACLTELAIAGDAAPPLKLLFRATHSLKGAARAVGRREVESVCHAMESLIVALQRGRLVWSAALGDALHDAAQAMERNVALGTPATPGELAVLLPRLQQYEVSVRAPAAPPRTLADQLPPAGDIPQAPALAVHGSRQGRESPAAPMPAIETVRIAARQLEQLLHQIEELQALKLSGQQRSEAVTQARVSCAGLRSGPADRKQFPRLLAEHEGQLRSLERVAHREQRQFGAAVDALLVTIKNSLLLPAAALRPFLVATVRELARSQDKDVQLRLEGDALQMDRRLLQELREPLVHLLRNAIAHGIEPAEAGARAGKTAQGRLTVCMSPRNGGRVLITISDDGAGVDTGKLAQAAREAGITVPDSAERADLLQLVFGSGVSTAELTHVAGRGIGLAIVRETVERLSGTVEVASAPGQGTTFTMVLPLSLATLRAVEVRSSGHSYLVPSSHVDRCVRYARSEFKTMGARLTVPIGERRVPFVSLAALLGVAAVPAASGNVNCVVLSAGDGCVAMAVDELVGECEVLSRPIPRTLMTSPIVAGAAAVGGGRTVPVLNPAELVRLSIGAARQGTLAELSMPAMRQTTHSILVVEDSLTSRTLLKNMLELAGHRVEVAGDGVEGLRKLRTGRFDLVVSDIEMPNLDGIALTQAIRADAMLARLPVILVTSLASPADRERGAEAGANAYIVKSDFEDGNLLQSIAELA
jgi:two-component system, chemotaxis family, sensor kinase CheA